MSDAALRSVATLARDLAQGKTTSRKLVEEALARIADAGGEGGRAFTKVHGHSALLAAEASDRLRKDGVVPSPLAGLPVSIKDLFDIAGDEPARNSARPACGGRGRSGGGAAARGRRGGHRPKQHDRIRVLRNRHQSALRHSGESLRPRVSEDSGRVLLGRRGFGRHSVPPPGAA
jgi:hypothetical protein